MFVKFVVRIALGATLGLVAVGGLSFAIQKWYLIALVGAVTGVVGFLGSFFIWSADRLDEGYEQVLFDFPNSATSLVLVVILVGAAFGGGQILSASAAPQLSPEEATASHAMGEQREALREVLVAYLGKPTSADLPEWKSKVSAASAVIANLSVPDSLAPMLVLLGDEANALSAAIEAQEKCNQRDTESCANARISASDASRADAKFLDEGALIGA